MRRGHQLAGSGVFELGRAVLWGWNTDLCGREAAQLVLASLSWEEGSMKLRHRGEGAVDGCLRLMSLKGHDKAVSGSAEELNSTAGTGINCHS